MLLNYDHVTGILTWKARDISLFNDGGHGAAHNRDKWNARWAGQEALACIKGDGYKHGGIHGKFHASHRIIWKWMTGEEPIDIDHQDGDRTNNKWANLRSVTRARNIRKDGVFIGLGCYQNKNDAIAARKQGEKEHGFHPNHGRAVTDDSNPAA